MISWNSHRRKGNRMAKKIQKEQIVNCIQEFQSQYVQHYVLPFFLFTLTYLFENNFQTVVSVFVTCARNKRCSVPFEGDAIWYGMKISLLLTYFSHIIRKQSAFNYMLNPGVLCSRSIKTQNWISLNCKFVKDRLLPMAMIQKLECKFSVFYSIFRAFLTKHTSILIDFRFRKIFHLTATVINLIFFNSHQTTGQNTILFFFHIFSRYLIGLLLLGNGRTSSWNIFNNLTFCIRCVIARLSSLINACPIFNVLYAMCIQHSAFCMV